MTNMRYILSEDVKHILLERFILRESDATDADIANTKNALAQLDTKVSITLWFLSRFQ